jgi:hypothetical protein
MRLVLGLLFLRALIPAGFMLGPVDGHLAVVLCNASLGAPSQPMAGMHHHHMGMGSATHDHTGHLDPTCPYAQSAGPAPLPALPVLAGTPALERLRAPTELTQTLLAFGPIRHQPARGPPRLIRS